MKNTLETRLGMFVALTLIAAVIILEMVGGFDKFRAGYHLRGLFANVHDLKVGDRVKMAGVDVGRVEKIQITNSLAEVRLKLEPSAPVKTDSVATIKFTGLMGQSFVSIEFGSDRADRLAENSLIQTTETPDISATVAKIDSVAGGVQKLTDSFTGVSIESLLGPLRDFIKDNSGPLSVTFSNMQAVSSHIAGGEGTVGKLIYDETLYKSALASITNLQDAASEIRGTVADARKAVDEINSGQGTLGKLLKDDTLYRETTSSMATLHEVLQKVNQGQGTVSKILNDREFYNNAKLTLQKLDKATESLEDQGPLSVMGILVNNLF